jgi:hypothetical protein
LGGSAKAKKTKKNLLPHQIPHLQLFTSQAVSSSNVSDFNTGSAEFESSLEH